MTPDERQLITGLFDRMRAFALPEKDREAETLINQAVRAMPDAPYMLVQSVLVQEQALEAANDRVQELEARVRDLEQGARPQQGGGSFLGGLFGGARPDAGQRPSSVPVIGSRAGGQPSAWASGGSQPLPQAPQQVAGGGFMRSAMTTAAGVAGGVLLAEGIRNMMGGSSAHATPATETSAKPKAEEVDDDPGVEEASSDHGDFDLGGDIEV